MVSVIRYCWVAVFLVFAGVGFWACQPKAEKASADGQSGPEKSSGAPGGMARMPVTFFPEKLAAMGPETCVECHAGIHEEWARSHHALANRPIDPELDRRAFVPTREVRDDGVLTTLSQQGSQFVVRVNEADGSVTEETVTGVIAFDPLIQYLAPQDNGAYQTTSLAYDPARNEWFEVFASENRLPGEWGHWMGQGMNWNANCAACHMTEFSKNYDWTTGQYQSTWLQQGISCAQCHGGLERHVREARKPGYTAPDGLRLDPRRAMENCATCHSRRGQLTDDRFRPGDRYHDHYQLSLPDQPGLYYPDGQIRDEVFVTGSFQMSRMGHAGVTCLDCHNAHSAELILPATNNMLCLRCHETGLDQAPVIVPTAHSHHPAGSTGNRCIECHMPHTTYMQRDPRRDHGFLSPDPLMTQELGIPNACNGCHQDQSVDWAVDWAERWYGEQLAEMPQRARARALAQAYAGQPAARALLELAAREEIPAWHAAYTGLLGNYVGEPHVIEFLRAQLTHDSPLVRARAARGLAPIPQSLADIYPLMEDEARSVRLAATEAFVGRTQLAPEKLSEWRESHESNSDRPQNAFILAEDALENGDSGTARTLVERAISLDRLNGGVYQQAAIVYSRLGDTEAAEQNLLKAMELAPDDPSSIYYLALLRAEQGNVAETIALLQDAVAIQPDFYRAWYNLALAYASAGQWPEADAALGNAAPGMRGSRPFEQARQAIDANLPE